MRQLSTEWTKTTRPENKQSFENAVRNSTVALGRLLEIAKEWERELTVSETRITDYDTPSWGPKQAHRNGDLSRIRKLIDLLSFLEGDR